MHFCIAMPSTAVISVLEHRRVSSLDSGVSVQLAHVDSSEQQANLPIGVVVCARGPDGTKPTADHEHRARRANGETLQELRSAG